VLTASNVILTLKIAVATVTVLLIVSLVALAKGRYRLHGRLNVVFFILTLAAVLGLEVLIRFVDRSIFDAFREEPLRSSLQIHLCFSIPALILMFAMLITGKMHSRQVHVVLAVPFGIAWVGTFVTGIFFLPVWT
jgi:hypothetical protein